MGTGKTVQVIALLSALLEKTGTCADALELRRRRKLANAWTVEQELAETRALEQGQIYRGTERPLPQYLPSWAPVLILAPSSILDNWITDSRTWGHFAIVLYQSADQYSGINEIRTGASEILLVSHKLFEMEGHFALLSEIPWKLVIVDEHHKLKNPKAKATMNLQKLRDTHRIPVIGLSKSCTVRRRDDSGITNIVTLCRTLFGICFTLAGTVMQNNHLGKYGHLSRLQGVNDRTLTYFA